MPPDNARRRGSRTIDTGAGGRKKKGRGKDPAAGETILYYVICPYCGAALDPGEKCDCKGTAAQLPEEQTEQEAEELERRRKYARRKARIAALRPAAPEHQQEAQP